jgi:2,3-diketo-5-methylthio-1-phosphopentane phosphatase
VLEGFTSVTWTILCDFDGTIAPDDVTDRLLEHFASPPWREIEQDWQTDKISSLVCLQRQTELLCMTHAQLRNALESVTVDPAFVQFVTVAQSRGCEVRVASEGFEQVIRLLLRRTDCPTLPIAATYLIPSGYDRWSLGFPFARADCASAAATCKCAVARPQDAAARPLLLIGDGRSDFCVAAHADFVFARGGLLRYCVDQGLPHAAVADFSVAQDRLISLLNKPLGPNTLRKMQVHPAKDTHRE